MNDEGTPIRLNAIANLATTITDCLRAHQAGATQEQIVACLHAYGLTITEAMKIVMKVYDLSLGEAKEIVANHPAWSSVVEASIPLHDLLEQLSKETGEHGGSQL